MHRAYALPLVLGLLLLLSAALGTVMIGINASQFVGESTVHRRQAFHNAEGVSVAVAELASAKLRSLPMQPDLPIDDANYKNALKAMLAEQLTQTNEFIDAERETFTTPGFVLERAQISDLGPAQLRLLASGPFQGMQAQVQSFNVDVIVQRAHTRTPGRQGIVASVERATMSMFQFYVFADGYLDLDPGGPVDTVGRIHANGDFCIAGQPRVQTVTSAKRILVSNNPNGHTLCRRRAGDGGTIKVLTSILPPTLATWPNSFDHTSSNWKSDAIAKFNGNLRDQAHDVAPLKMPLSGKPIVQAGANVLAMERVSSGAPDRLVPIDKAKEDNTTSMRFLVDPMLVGEPEDVRRQKFAFKADLRIIDGVWYLRDPLVPEQPGLPIWSDHPGSGSIAIDDDVFAGDASLYSTMVATSNNVGQENLRGARGWGGNTPKQFSYYGFQRASDATLTWARTPGPLTTSTRAVVSYGLLAPAGGSVWNPGAYNAAGAPTSLAAASTLQEYLRGTQHGIKNGWLEVRSEERGTADGDGVSPAEEGRSRTLPLNFDIAGLTAALRNCVTGELGSYFPGTCFDNADRRFNGIVFISSTWPGALNGFADTAAAHDFPVLAPFNAAGGNTVLPSSLCAAQSSSLPSGITPATAQRCANTNRGNGAFASVVRVFNGKHVSPKTSKTYAGVDIPAKFYPRGLSIVSNLPIIALGDMNVDTTPLDGPESLGGGDYFVPVLIAGDRFHRHSVNWSDARANWQQPMSGNSRDGHETRQYIEILAGWNPTPSSSLSGHDHSSDGFEDFPRYNECWSGKAIYRGSIVVAFSSVYERAGANNADGHPGGGGYLTCFPGRDEGFDFHLQDPLNQPPGAPMIVAQSIGFWRAQ